MEDTRVGQRVPPAGLQPPGVVTPPPGVVTPPPAVWDARPPAAPAPLAPAAVAPVPPVAPAPIAPAAVASVPAAPAAADPAAPAASIELPGASGWTWGQARDVVWTVLGAVGLVYVGWSLLSLLSYGLLVFGLAAVLAIVVRPAVEGLQRRSKLPMGAAAVLAYICLVGLVGALGGWAVTQLGTQLTALAQALPASYAAVHDRIPVLEAYARSWGLAVDVQAMSTGLLAELQRTGLQSTGLAAQGLAWATALGGAIVTGFLALVLSFYFVVDGERLAVGLVAVAPTRSRPYLLFAEKTLLRMISGYLRGQLTVGLIVGTCVFTLCTLSGVRYSVVLAVLAFFCELVPLLGPIITGSAVALVGLVDSFWLALAAACLYYLLRTTVVYVLGPRIVQRYIGLHPIATILGLAVAVRLFGVWGLLLTSPALGFVSVLVAAVYRQARGLEPNTALVPRRLSLPRFR